MNSRLELLVVLVLRGVDLAPGGVYALAHQTRFSARPATASILMRGGMPRSTSRKAGSRGRDRQGRDRRGQALPHRCVRVQEPAERGAGRGGEG